MNHAVEIILNHPVMESLGWVLLHFLWQGSVVAIVLLVVLAALRRASANVRYLVSCAALFGTVLLPAITYSLLPVRETTDRSKNMTKESSFPVSVAFSQVTTSDHLDVLADDGSAVKSIVPEFNQAFQNEPPAFDKSPQNSLSRFEQSKRWLRPWVPFLTCAWLLGVTVLSLRLLSSWIQVQRLQRHGSKLARVEQIDVLNRLARKLNIHRTVRLLESVVVEVPTVIGWLKPVILLPVASVNSLTVQQLEAILAHELAHIRRADYAVNLVQSLIETLLFYHPAVWWISSRIRQEREHCCDDLATSISGDAAGYVAALVRMEELRCEPRGVAVAARGGDLLSRVRRLLFPSTPDRLAPRWLTGAAAMLIAAALVGVPLLTKSQAEPAAARSSTSQQNENLKAAAEEKKQPATDEKPKSTATTNLDEIKPAEIADRIEEARKRYASVEYTATIEQTRNTSAFQPDAKPTLVKGTGSVAYRADGERWFCDLTSFSYPVGATKTYPTHTISSFDGSIHRVLERQVLKICQEDPGAHQYAPAEFFWKAGISSDRVLSALRRPEAKLIERIQMAETSCLNVRVEWKPAGSETERSLDIMICPEQGWLVRRVIIEDGGELLAEWSIGEVAKTESGLHYPVEFKVIRPETDDTPLTIVNISKFQERTDFEPHEFQVPNPIGIDIVDYRSGMAWHNDPWWNELAPWAQENLAWPQPDLRPLASLQSYSPPELEGAAAPELVAGEWLNQPGKLAWGRPERTVTVLYFFAGGQYEPTPGQISALSQLNRKYAGSGLEIIGIAAHSRLPEITRQMVRELAPSFPIMIDAKANEADSKSGGPVAHLGANFVSNQLKLYTGTFIVNKARQLILVDNEAAGPSPEVSQLELLVRNELLKVNGTSDPPALRQAQVNRTSRLLRGTQASAEELAAAVNDQSPLWLQNAQQAIAASMSDAQRELLKSYGETVESTIEDLESPSLAPVLIWRRLEEEWKRRANNATGNGVIAGKVQLQNDAEGSPVKAKLTVEPVFEMLITHSSGAWHVAKDRSRTLKIETDDSGAFLVEKLPKGSYHVTADVRGKPKAKQKVHLPGNESRADLNFKLAGGDTIAGKVTDAAGNPVPKATVKAVKRFLSAEAFETERYTTEDIPQEIETSNDNGDFVFDSLFEGAYQFEVSAEGFETTTTDAVPAGFSGLRVILKPVAPDQAAAESRAIVGRVMHQGQPVANARVGLQAASDLKRFGDNELFVATAVTGDDGQYVLTVPNTVDSNSSVAIWAVGEGFQPTRENVVMNVDEASEMLQNITLAKSSGCVLQISDANGTPIPNAAVIVPSQTLPEDIDFEIPKDWRDLVSGTTDAEGIVSLPYVVPEAMTEVQIQVPGQDSLVVATGNYFLNAKPAAKAPHHHFKLPKFGSLEGNIEVKDGPLPQDLTLEISTETSMTDEPRRLQTLGVAKAKVGADGRFKVDSIAAGTLTIKPFLAVDQPLRAELLPRNIQVIAGETTLLYFPVVKGVHLRGRIVASDSGNGLAGVRFQILYGSSAQEPQNMDNNIDIVTDDQGRYQAWVPPGRVILRISWRDRKYGQVEYWSPRASSLGSAFEVPEAEEFELEPITFVPSKELNGRLVDQDGQPLVNWSVFGYPEIPGKSTEYITCCFGGTSSDGEGKFSSLYPSTFPPAVWKVSHRDWPTPYESDELKWIAKVISRDPLILQVDTNPAPPDSLRNAANSGDVADDDAIATSGLNGKWSLQSMQWNGIKVPEEQCRQTTMTIEGHQLTFDKYWNISFTNIDPVTRVAEGGFTAETGLAGAIRLNSPQMPNEIDLTINGVGTAEQEEQLGEDERAAIQSGKLKVYGLCKVNGDELQLCLSDARMDAPLARPTEFSAGESSERTLFVFKRTRP